MVVPKIKGIETEWGAVVRGPENYYESADLSAFYLMVNVIRKFFGLSVFSRFSFLRDVENIERLSEGNGFDDLLERERYLNLDEIIDRERYLYRLGSEGFLPNGARCYIDGPHFEYSTPECLSAKTLVAADKAGEIITNLARIAANKSLNDSGREIIIYKDTSDRMENSYGCHENYLVSRKLFSELTESESSPKAGQLICYLVARQIFTGSGGINLRGKGIGGIGRTFYQISQRADFINRLLASDTVINRGIINLRNEPHADWKRFARLHVIVGDANLSEIATYLKAGITSIILEMLENGLLEGDLILNKPLEAIRLVSRDLSCKGAVIEMQGGKRISSLDLNWKFFENAKKYFEAVREPNAEEKDLLLKWEEILSDFSFGNEARLRRRLDWKIKQDILENFLKAHDCDWRNVDNVSIKVGRNSYGIPDQLFKKDLLYHILDKEKSLYRLREESGEIDKILEKGEMIKLIKSPPEDTRAYFRGKCLERFYSQIEDVDWELISLRKKTGKRNGNFDVETGTFTQICLLNPEWGKKEDVEEFFDKEFSFEEILDKLSGSLGGE